MSLRDKSDRIEQRDAGSARQPRSSASIWRKRILGVFILLLMALMLTVYAYYQCTYFGLTDWHGFSGYVVGIAGWLVFNTVLVFRKNPKL